MSTEDELIVEDHLDVFREHGFVLIFNRDDVPGRRVQLKSCVLSHTKTFGVEEIYEVMALLKDSPEKAIGQLSRMRSLIASKACRKSIMIGTALEKPAMQDVVSRLAKLEKPWRCPHGRPTMRHLMDLAAFQKQIHHKPNTQQLQ